MMRMTPAFALCLAAATASACGGSVAAPNAAASRAEPSYARVSATAAPEGTGDKIKWAMAGEHRAESRPRDAHRHPLETLTFFGLKDDMTVVELYPGRGWYTEILAPVLRDRGRLVVTNWNPVTNQFGASLDRKLKASPALYDKVNMVVIDPPKSIPLGPDGSADLVLTFRNIHNWLDDGDTAAIFAAAFKVLKSGGTLGVVEHRAASGTTLAHMQQTGYVTEDKAIELANAAGFQLTEKSEINANPRDTKNHPNGVWSLPPSLRGGDVDKAKYLAIGESDRMTLKFKKP